MIRLGTQKCPECTAPTELTKSNTRIVLYADDPQLEHLAFDCQACGTPLRCAAPARRFSLDELWGFTLEFRFAAPADVAAAYHRRNYRAELSRHLGGLSQTVLRRLQADLPRMLAEAQRVGKARVHITVPAKA